MGIPLSLIPGVGSRTVYPMGANGSAAKAAPMEGREPVRAEAAPPPQPPAPVDISEEHISVDDVTSREPTERAGNDGGLSALLWNWAANRTPDAAVTPASSTPINSPNPSQHNGMRFYPGVVEEHARQAGPSRDGSVHSGSSLWNWGAGRGSDPSLSTATTPNGSVHGGNSWLCSPMSRKSTPSTSREASVHQGRLGGLLNLRTPPTSVSAAPRAIACALRLCCACHASMRATPPQINIVC